MCVCRNKTFVVANIKGVLSCARWFPGLENAQNMQSRDLLCLLFTIVGLLCWNFSDSFDKYWDYLLFERKSSCQSSEIMDVFLEKGWTGDGDSQTSILRETVALNSRFIFVSCSNLFHFTNLDLYWSVEPLCRNLAVLSRTKTRKLVRVSLANEQCFFFFLL